MWKMIKSCIFSNFVNLYMCKNGRNKVLHGVLFYFSHLHDLLGSPLLYYVPSTQEETRFGELVDQGKQPFSSLTVSRGSTLKGDLNPAKSLLYT